MFHHSPTVTEAALVAPHWRAAVAVGDIIRWPLDGTAEGLGLIVEVEHVAGWPVLTVAPGVADVSQAVSPGTLRLIRLDEVRQSGLTAPVRFLLGLRVGIPLSHPAFDDEVSPVIGHLCDSALERLHAERARLYALRDIAAAQRRERRAQRRADTRTGWRPGPRRVSPRSQEAL